MAGRCRGPNGRWIRPKGPKVQWGDRSASRRLPATKVIRFRVLFDAPIVTGKG